MNRRGGCLLPPKPMSEWPTGRGVSLSRFPIATVERRAILSNGKLGGPHPWRFDLWLCVSPNGDCLAWTTVVKICRSAHRAWDIVNSGGLNPRLLMSRISRLLLVAIQLPVCGAVYDFNDGTDSGWTHFDLSAVGQAPSTFSFPSDGTGGKAYRIFSPAPAVTSYGPARTMSYLADTVYSNFTVSVD